MVESRISEKLNEMIVVSRYAFCEEDKIMDVLLLTHHCKNLATC